MSSAGSPSRARQAEEDSQDSGEDIAGGNKRGLIAGSEEDAEEDDSSEEDEDDDPEEARRIAQGFIVDEEEDEEQEDDDEQERRRKRKRRKQKRRRQLEEENEELDEDDLDLLAENTGVKRRKEERKLKRFRRGSATPAPEPRPDSRPEDLSHMFDDDDEDGPAAAVAATAKRRADTYEEEEEEEEDDGLPSAANALRRTTDARSRRERDLAAQAAPSGFEDDMEDFIDDDEDSDMDASISDGEREARRAEKRRLRKEEREARKASKSGLDLDPTRAGIDQDQWEELNDVFGNGEDYAWAFKKGDREGEEGALEEEEEDEMYEDELADEQRKKKLEFKDIFEPAAIKERMLTDDDDRIRRADFPERWQLALPGEDGLQLLERQLTSSELDDAARWVNARISQRCYRLFLSPEGEFNQFLGVWQQCVRTTVAHVLNKRRDAMYLYVHHADEHELRTQHNFGAGNRQGATIITLLNRRDLQSLVSACLRFKSLLARKDSLRKLFERLLQDDVNATQENQSLAVAPIVPKGAPSQEQRNEFAQLLARAESTEEVADVADWLNMQFGQKLRDAQAIETGLSLNGGSATTFKKPAIVSRYERVKATMALDFARKVAMPAAHLYKNYEAAHGRPYTWQDPTEDPATLAGQYFDAAANMLSAERVLDEAKLLLANEIGRDPSMRQVVRSLFRDFAFVSVAPTERGESVIHEEHPFYNFKYLISKPVPEFREHQAPMEGQLAPAVPNPVQFLLMLEAEEKLLVNIDVRLSPHQVQGFEDRLTANFAGEHSTATSYAWTDFRREVIKAALEDFLLPVGKTWVKEWLREECQDWLGRACEVQLSRRIDCKPYQSKSMHARLRDEKDAPSQWDAEQDDEDDTLVGDKHSSTVPSVLAISAGQGDPRRDTTKAVFLNARGKLIEGSTFDGLAPPRGHANDAGVSLQRIDERDLTSLPSKDRETYQSRMAFIDLLKRRRPDVVVVNGFSARTVALRSLAQLMATKAEEELVSESRLPPLGTPQGTAEREKLCIDVISVDDDVARLYQHSARAADEHPSLDVLTRYCVALARYAQSPLNEFAALEEGDLLSVRYDANQQLLPKAKLAMHLERAISASVCHMCIDINRASTDAYYAAMLKFVSGLGPRKATALIQTIKAELEGVVINRLSLLIGAQDSLMRESEVEILTLEVWHNACPFLVVRGVKSQRYQGSPDVLDGTRIHPENYRYARFIAFDALQKNEEDLDPNEHPSQFCSELLRDQRREAKVSTIDLSDYEAKLLQEQQDKGETPSRKLTLLNMVARELVYPCVDARAAFVRPTSDALLSSLTGETSQTLSGIVAVTVVSVQPEHVIVRLASGIEGTINGEYLRPYPSEYYQMEQIRPPSLRDIVKPMQTINAQIIDVDKDTFRVELTARPDHLENAAAHPSGRAVLPDQRYFDHEAAAMAKAKAEDEVRRKMNLRNVRSINHPYYKNFNSTQAEQYLADSKFDIGEAIVRRSSKGSDHLAVTWKVAPGVFQHVDVLELDKENEYELGRTLRVGNMGSYSDIDELLVGHIAPMAAMVRQLLHHEKYQGEEAQLDQVLISFTQANPNRSTYGFALDRKRPGAFILGFKANRDAKIQKWPVKVLPGRFKLLETDHLPNVTALCNSFKSQYTSMVGMQRGGRTPGGGLGGATPRALGMGTTPYGAGLGSATPAPMGFAAMPPGAPPAPPPGFPNAQPPGPPPSRPPSNVHPDRWAMQQGGAY
ncbi:Transcription elongation factor SPT6 [Ceraceosorus bombacis]|uniref:Transcription elongation factor SPT6 n=1 Tax=Ceraceosorus bombacis TaxID=401625 RepID=A0A0P1B9G9_9BASI|nr:Transcription elongation factor SPT6 [Ceraceosorus bombacis]